MKLYQPKVTQTQRHSDSQGEHIVCEGKLIFLRQDLLPGKYEGIIFRLDNQLYQPIIISNEEIEVGDWYYNLHKKEVLKCDNKLERDSLNHFIETGECKKILALPEQFSDKHLQAIVDGKVEDGDEVLVKCRKWKSQYLHGYEVHLDQQNHITLFPVQQYLEVPVPREIFQEWVDRLDLFEWDVNRSCSVKEDMEKFISEWAVKNNYKG